MAERWLTVALPKGRLAAETADLLVAAGLPTAADADGRRLVEEDAAARIRFAWLRPEDALTYVERGVAALALVGKDVLVEREAAVDEVADLGIGRCRVSLAVPEGMPWPLPSPPTALRPLRLATHLPRLAARWFRARGMAVDIIHLRGSVEIAPRLGLAEAVVDIVQTGTTLRANGLREVESILPVTCRLVANPRVRRAGDDRLAALIDRLSRAARDRAGGESATGDGTARARAGEVTVGAVGDPGSASL